MDSEPEKKSTFRKSSKSYVQYTGLAFQLAGILLISIFAGKKLDIYFGFSKPYITAILSMVALVGFMYKLYLDLMKPSE
ncbi:MAG: AtpZ/AtpI family protein [Saprospiraceae bacterium]|nr:AtpZ/AtpI family protein [Saprospiraceae bacterium]